MRTFLRSSLVVADMFGESGIVLVECSWNQVFRDAKIPDSYLIDNIQFGYLSYD